MGSAPSHGLEGEIMLIMSNNNVLSWFCTSVQTHLLLLATATAPLRTRVSKLGLSPESRLSRMQQHLEATSQSNQVPQ